MSGREHDEAIAARARAALDRSCEQIDEPTRARLRAARLRALAGLDAPRSFAGGRRLAAASAALALAVAVSWWLRALPPPLALEADLEDVEILTAAEDLELYDELDFYRWLADDEPI